MAKVYGARTASYISIITGEEPKLSFSDDYQQVCFEFKDSDEVRDAYREYETCVLHKLRLDVDLVELNELMEDNVSAATNFMNK